MKLGAQISPALFSLLEKNPTLVDYIEVNGEQSLDQLEQSLALRPVILHDVEKHFWLNYENPFDEAVMTKARAMLERARPPWYSTGIGASAEPQGHTTEFWRGAPDSALQPRERCLANIVRNGKRLAQWAGMPLILENFNYHPTNAYEYVCEPQTYTRLIDEIGCDMLLDLSHARISAAHLGWPSPQAYLAELPLARVREIHMAHPLQVGQNRWIDKHGPVQPEDLDLLRWTLERTPHAAAITIESESPSEAELEQEVALLKEAMD